MIDDILNIYFVESINTAYPDNQNDAIEYYVVLLDVTKDSGKGSENNLNYQILNNLPQKQIENIKEGQFVFYSDENKEFSNANGSKIARQHFLANNVLRPKIIGNNENVVSKPISFSDDAAVFSYHINVGHGNCSIIVINNCHFWLVDCSNYDYTNKINYNKNIEACLSDLKTKFSLTNVVFERVFITHSHFDHYSGILFLFDKGYIDRNTEFFLNLYYSNPSSNYTKMLSMIYELSCPVIEPTASLQTKPQIEIWHPEIRTLRTKSKPNNRNQNNNTPVQLESNVNNSSVLYCFKIGGKTILFTGDLETQKLDKLKHCFNDLNIYAISHHGSINGHVRNHCPIHNKISQVTDCFKKKDSIKILMGRDNAYKGIYSQKVISDCVKIYYTEKYENGKQCKYFEIDWQNNKIQYVF